MHDLIAFAHGLADASGEVIRPYFRQPLDVTNKAALAASTPSPRPTGRPSASSPRPSPRAGPITASSARSTARRSPRRGYAGSSIPIDGTRAFIMGWPMWGTLIGLLDGATPVLGLMDQPFTRERYWSAGGGSYMRVGRRRRRSASRPAPARSSPTRSCRRRIPTFSRMAPKRRASRGSSRRCA